jgi:uncharacterized protein YndB with AHSA1/START domain
MENNQQTITVQAQINELMDKVWTYWTSPEHITNWNFASDDWHSPNAKNDLQVGGKFSYTMASKDGCMAFDFNGIYTNIIPHQLIEYTIEGGRKVKLIFEQADNSTIITEIFEPENLNSLELQKSGWQAILNNFKKYVESN